MGKVLVTGASGYIGGRLVPERLARGYKIRVMVDILPGSIGNYGQCRNCHGGRSQIRSSENSLKRYRYCLLFDSFLAIGKKEFAAADIQAAINFRIAAEENQIKRIIYLGGLGDTQTKLSLHLQSRIQVSEELRMGKVPVTALRAAIIIGSGSASYEIIKNLVRRLPVIFIPRWAMTKCQPIAIRDVIKYLVGVLEVPETWGGSFDIGGDDILDDCEMLKFRANY